MARELRLYRTISINYGDHVHYFTRSQSIFLNNIDSYKEETLSIDNYRINANIAKCKLTTHLTETNYDQITYIADVDTTKNYYRYYRVISGLIQSGYVVFTLEVDEWATYITKCGIGNNRIIRSTRLLGGGFYDEIKLTDGRMHHELYDGQRTASVTTHFKSTSVYIIFLLNYNLSQAVFGDDKISATELFCASLADIVSHADTSEGSLGEYKTHLEIALSLIGGIYGVNANFGDNDAQVLKAWLVPVDEIEYADYGVSVKTKSVFCGGNNHQATFNVTKVLPSKWDKLHIINNYNPNNVYYAGTYNNGLKLRNYAGSDLRYYTHVLVGDSDVKVIAQQGERQQDITQGYEVKLTTNGATKTELRKVADALSTSITLGTSTYGKMAALGGAGGAGFSLAGLDIVKGVAGMVNQFGIESARGNGDGFLTYYQTNPLSEVLSPYCVTYFTSLNDEVERAKLYGLNYVDKIYDEPLGMLFIDVTPLDANYIDFLQCLSDVSGIPKSPADFITNELARGIWIQDIG